jgi:hypothetical protein
MPRPMSGAMLTALQASILHPAILVQLNFVTGTVYVWSGTGPMVWNGQTYVGVGTFGGISVIEEGATIEAKGVTLTLSGIDPAMLADALQEIQIGLPVSVFLALFDSSGALIADPLTSWSGRMDQPEFLISGGEAVISLKCENRLMDMNVAVDRRLTLQDAQMSNPGDLGLQFVPSLQEVTLYWGTVPQSTNNI